MTEILFWFFYNNNSIVHMDRGVQMSCMSSSANIITNMIVMNFILFIHNGWNSSITNLWLTCGLFIIEL
jgi:hypothetical protein